MGQKLICDTVKDLLPMYIDHITSEASNQSIEEHLNGCEECKTVLEQMKKPVAVESVPEIKEFKKFLKKSKMSIFYWIMGVAALIAVITCFIVNLAVEGGISWFYIVAAGILTAYVPAYIAINAKKYKFVKMLAALNLCTVFLVAIIQLVLYYAMNQGEMWFWKIGLPVTVLWSAVLWFGVACRMFFRANLILTIGIIAALAVPASYLTNQMSWDYEGIAYGLEQYFENFVHNGLGNLVVAVILITAGIIRQLQKKAQA